MRHDGAEWQRDSRPLLTNFDNMYQPCVVETGGEYRFRMWFFGWAWGHANPGLPGADAIFHARSKDLRTWEVYSGHGAWDTTMDPRLWAAVVVPSERWYDCWHNGDPSVVLRDGRFYMAYSATSQPFDERPGYPAAMVGCIMGATSDDGIHWRKTDWPLLIRREDQPMPGPEPDRIGDFARPCLRWEDGRWRLWFDYWLPRSPGGGWDSLVAGHVPLGHAENRGEFGDEGAFRVTHDLHEPLLLDWPNPEVVKIGDRYHSFSDPPGYPAPEGAPLWMARQLREAVSADGISWTTRGFIPPDPDADACHVPQALVTDVDGRRWLYLFYATQVGYRRNDGCYHYQYDRIRAMRRSLDAVG